ncbi:DUF1254 domain-containing protein [Aureimonas sp. AU22]|jgi:uncharacterized membrane protein|uniref:DUF1254 domain-containing protein n=1 Tax=Aureimonas sp. AU22 TaxID=1638162 RepID=UPI0007843673|nr:DUF1254 domain-containing protein [Aureimonas sp. AU22]
MGKLVLALLIGLVGAAIVHIGIIFSIPLQAENDAWGRLSRLGDLFAVVRIEGRPSAAGNQPGAPGFAFIDPAFIDAACRFSLENGPARVTADERTGFWTASVYARNGDNLYSISERVALEGALDLLVGTREQLDLARVEGSELPDQTISVEMPSEEGYVMVRSLVDSESERPFVDRFVRSIGCRPATDEEAGTPTG